MSTVGADIDRSTDTGRNAVAMVSGSDTDRNAVAMVNGSDDTSPTVALGRRPMEWAISGAILAGASFFWFGRAQIGERLGTLLSVGAIVAVIEGIIAAVIGVCVGGPVTMSEDSAARRASNLWIGVEVVAIVLGLGVLKEGRGTSVALTDEGRAAFARYRATLQELLG